MTDCIDRICGCQRLPLDPPYNLATPAKSKEQAASKKRSGLPMDGSSASSDGIFAMQDLQSTTGGSISGAPHQQQNWSNATASTSEIPCRCR